MFPRCELSFDGFQKLLGKLNAAGVKVSKNIKTDTKSIDTQDVRKLRRLTKEYFGDSCEFQWLV